MKAEEHPAAQAGLHPSVRSALSQRVTPQAVMSHILPLHKDKSQPAMHSPMLAPSQVSTLRVPPKTAPLSGTDGLKDQQEQQEEGDGGLRVSSGNYNLPAGYTPILESVNTDIKGSHVTPMRLPSTLTTEDFTRAVAVATVSALRHQGSIVGSHNGGSARKDRAPVQHQQHVKKDDDDDDEEGGGHEAPSWTRGVSAGVLLSCTLLYAIIAGKPGGL